MWGDHWVTVLADLQNGPCAATPHLLTGADCSDPPAWFATAIPTHVADEETTPANKAWDDQWISIYTDLASHWGSGCGQ